MKKNTTNLSLCRMLFATGLIISNVVTAKLIITGLTIFGVSVTLPGAAVCYAITFLMTDVIGEIWGKKEANKTVLLGFVCQVLASLLIILTKYLPAVDQTMQTSYDMLLGLNWVFVIGSLTAYFVSQTWDVWIFHKIRKKVVNKKGNNIHRWMWNNASTMTSQILDTIIFIGISFGLGFGWFFDSAMWPTLGAMMIGQYFLKLLLAVADTPVFYLLTRGRKNER